MSHLRYKKNQIGGNIIKVLVACHAKKNNDITEYKTTDIKGYSDMPFIDIFV